jgi:hypothetical protein
MTRRPKFWLIAGALFTVINVVGAPQALIDGELLHFATHVVLTALGVYFLLRITRPAPQHVHDAQQANARIDQLQQSVDAIALDVERIGEAQRYISKLAAEQVEIPRKPQP